MLKTAIAFFTITGLLLSLTVYFNYEKLKTSPLKIKVKSLEKRTDTLERKYSHIKLAVLEAM